MSVYDDNLAKFPELEDIGKWLENNKHNFLQSIYENSKKWKLSERQIEAASRSWKNITQDKPEKIDIPKNHVEIYKLVADKYLPHTYYNQGQSDFLYKMLDVAEKGKMSQKQYNSMFKIFYKFRKSILKKIFGNYGR